MFINIIIYIIYYIDILHIIIIIILSLLCTIYIHLFICALFKVWWGIFWAPEWNIYFINMCVFGSWTHVVCIWTLLWLWSITNTNWSHVFFTGHVTHSAHLRSVLFTSFIDGISIYHYQTHFTRVVHLELLS